ncbi:unknown similar to AMEV121 [Mythimna separata entomopoxvirus 'L']|uniref:Uncharacterized protein n=1 Tax=Mythimna separata entomopoxvirus 'L' TaxID=1293572 RepID=A0A916NYF2_9POXV|nr:unknown similar to AMEV121 [Mythimna separata entomopoxvirus 'L']CCU56333.1 unknown similar to AMEV121 [Mythimna separata entomopoxvirus 'L']
MINPFDFDLVEDIEENIKEVVLEDDCKEFITFNKEFINQYKSLFDNIGKLIYKLDEKTKYKIHKFFTNNLSKLHLFKSKTLLPCYVAMYYHYIDNILLNATMCKYLFTLEIKQKKIEENIKLISDITNNKIEYPLYDVSYLIKGWVYTIDNKICENLLDYFQIINRLIIINLKMSIDKNKKISTIPTHFDIYKKIDNYVFILLYYIVNHTNMFKSHKEKIEIIFKLIRDSSINKSHYKITYAKQLIDMYINPLTKQKYNESKYINCC